MASEIPRDIDAELKAIKAPIQTDIENLYREQNMVTLEKQFLNILANRAAKIEQAALFTQREKLAVGLSWLRFPGEDVKDLISNTTAIFIDLRKSSGIGAVSIKLKEFDHGGYSKNAIHNIVVQRAENTQLPSPGGVWNEATLWNTSLVAIADDREPAPVIKKFREPNKEVIPNISFVYNFQGTTVESPLVVAVPIHESFARHTANSTHDGVSMYCQRVLLLARHNQREAVVIEPSSIPLAKPKANVGPRNVLPSR